MAKKKSKAKPKTKSKVKKTKAKAKPAKKRATAKAKPAKAKKSRAVAAKKPARKKVAKKKKQTVGEGNYEASRKFDRDQAGFVNKNSGKIAALGKAAEKALEGPEGDSLREAEAAAAGRSRDTF